MTEEALRTPEDPNGTGVNSGVVGSQPTQNQGSVSQDDFNAWKSSMDQQISMIKAQNDQLARENQNLKNQNFESKLEDLPEAERYKLMYEQERERTAEAQRAANEHAAKQQYANDLSQEFGIPAGQLMIHNDAPAMRAAAKEFYRQQVIAEIQPGATPTSPTSTPAPGGATLQQREPERSKEEVQKEALFGGDPLAFVASFTND